MKTENSCNHETMQTTTNIYGTNTNTRSLKACIQCGKVFTVDKLDPSCRRGNEFELNTYTLHARSIGDISDGYHTFDELYNHRMVLFAIICNTYKDKAWKSWKHHDGTMYDDYFIVGITVDGVGDYSYHYHKSEWNKFGVKELEFAPEWDGHKPEHITRLFGLLSTDEEVFSRRRPLIVGQKYVLNEDMKSFIHLDNALYGQEKKSEDQVIKAGTECTLVKIKEFDLIVIDINDSLITTESHMIDEIKS